MNEKISGYRSFERALKGLDKTVRKAAYKSDGVSKQHWLTTRQRQTASGRVKGCEKSILCEYPCVGETIQQGRLTCIGIANDGDLSETASITTFPLERTSLSELPQFGLKCSNSTIDLPAVGF